MDIAAPPGGRYVAWTEQDKGVRLLDPERGEIIATWPDTGGRSVMQPLFSPDGAWLAWSAWRMTSTTGPDPNRIAWSVRLSDEPGEPTEIAMRELLLRAVAFGPDGHLLLEARRDDTAFDDGSLIGPSTDHYAVIHDPATNTLRALPWQAPWEMEHMSWARKP
jgi:hypothetical protein